MCSIVAEDRRLRQQQDAEYAAGLAQDQANDRARAARRAAEESERQRVEAAQAAARAVAEVAEAAVREEGERLRLLVEQQRNLDQEPALAAIDGKVPNR